MGRKWWIVLVIAIAFVGVRPAAASQHWVWPLDQHEVGHPFDLSHGPYGAGNRGADLRGHTGDVVRSVAAGTISYVGVIDHVRIVVVDHGAQRSTYQPVAARVKVGDGVTAGQVIGTLLDEGSHCRDTACLHLGRKVGDSYLDPLALISAHGNFRLISPEGPPPTPPTEFGGELLRPVGGRITSPYGMRTHPITGVRKLHDGTDFGVACGTAVHAAATGLVVMRGQDPAYGNRIILSHPGGLTTSYNHLQSQSVSVGDRVGAGDVVGHAGATGLATGCHLHFMAQKGGKTVNPMDLL
jgi:murein DD-endopeptidase MepM/ murein hydrolase activator NlpD